MTSAAAHRRQVAVALVCQGFAVGGGVPAVTRWLREGLMTAGGFSVEIFDLATSRTDSASRRLAAPRTWARRSLQDKHQVECGVQHWGANAVELEGMRYLPRAELTRRLNEFDLIQVVCGGPALGAVVSKANPPSVLQVATIVAWERQSKLDGLSGFPRAWHRAMALLTTHIERNALRAASIVLVENDEMAKYVRQTGQQHVIKAPPGIDCDRFTPREEGWASAGYLLSVCRLGEPRKGLDRTLAAYRQLVSANADVPDLILAGKGAPAEDVTSLLNDDLLRDRVSIRSDVSPSKLPDLYRGASVFIQTSHEEGLGISVLEAMASGLPVVATETAGSRECVVDGATGFLVPQAARHALAPSLADRITRVLHTEGHSMAKVARRRAVEYFSRDVTLGRFVRAYELVLGDRPSR